MSAGRGANTMRVMAMAIIKIEPQLDPNDDLALKLDFDPPREGGGFWNDDEADQDINADPLFKALLGGYLSEAQQCW